MGYLKGRIAIRVFENKEKYVVYRRLYGDGSLWIRPIDMFLDEINKNGQKYRFELQESRRVSL